VKVDVKSLSWPILIGSPEGAAAVVSVGAAVVSVGAAVVSVGAAVVPGSGSVVSAVPPSQIVQAVLWWLMYMVPDWSREGWY
jgi:hypothetical protein